MNFEDALRAVKNGKKVRRRIWGGSGYADRAYLVLSRPSVIDGQPVMQQLLVGYDDGPLRPFAGANWDLLADDWEIVE